MQIGDKLRRLRLQRGLTQEELADRCELSKGFISLLERDLTSPSIATLTDVLECLEPLVATIPLQLLAYHVAVCKGKNVDQPRNLAKSVTVE